MDPMQAGAEHPTRHFGLTLIAIGKAVKALVLSVVGAFALVLAKEGSSETLLHKIDSHRGDPASHLWHRGLEAVSGLSTRGLEALGVGAFVYAALFVVEGVGLWKQRRWAEYLTVIITLSFLPIELYELAHRVTMGKLIALAFNLVVLVYLLVLLRRERA